MLREIDLGKNKAKSSLISTAPNINDTILLHRFKKLKEALINYNDNDDDDDDDDNNDNNINNSKNNNFDNISLSPLPSPIKLSNILKQHHIHLISIMSIYSNNNNNNNNDNNLLIVFYCCCSRYTGNEQNRKGS